MTIPTIPIHEQMLAWCAVCNDVHDDECGDHPTIITRADLIVGICARCAGHGELRGYPGVYTQDDFDEDPDMLEGYLEHRRPCEDCRGSGRCWGLTDEAEERPAVVEFLRDLWNAYAIDRAEARAFGY